MAETENLTLTILRSIQSEIAGLRADVRDLTVRQNDMALTLAGVRRDQAQAAEETAHMHVRYDRLLAELEKINRRLDVLDAVSEHR